MTSTPPKATPYPLFDPEGVAANRRGELTPVQRTALEQSARDIERVPLVVLPLFVVAYAVLAGVLALLARQSVWNWLQSHAESAWIGAAGLLVIAARGVYQRWRYARPGRRALEDSRVVSMSGKVTEQAGTYVLDIEQGERRGERITLHGWPGAPPGIYRFYYLDGPNRLLSVEPLTRIAIDTPPNGRGR